MFICEETGLLNIYLGVTNAGLVYVNILIQIHRILQNETSVSGIIISVLLYYHGMKCLHVWSMETLIVGFLINLTIHGILSIVDHAYEITILNYVVCVSPDPKVTYDLLASSN